MGNFKNLSGNKFDRLEVLERARENAPGNEIQWICRCSCGSTITVRRGDLIKGKVKSCGCLKRESSRENGKKCITHGMTRTRLYKEWAGMKQRCYNVNSPIYKDYGFRGIVVCDEWKDDYMAFYEWSIKSGYDETAPRGVCTLERKDNNGPYSPENCRWATIKEQSLNKRNTVRLTYNGETLLIPEWAERTGLSSDVIRQRRKKGWPVQRILTEPLHREKQNRNHKLP